MLPGKKKSYHWTDWGKYAFKLREERVGNDMFVIAFLWITCPSSLPRPFFPRRVIWSAFTTVSVSLILVVLVFILYHQGCPIALPTTSVLQLGYQIPLSNLQEPENGECSSQQKGYHAVTCPVWYDERDPPSDLDPISRERGIDYRVHYLHKRQNSQGDCMEQNYYTKGFRDMSIFNSFKLLLARGLFAATLTDRVSTALYLSKEYPLRRQNEMKRTRKITFSSFLFNFDEKLDLCPSSWEWVQLRRRQSGTTLFLSPWANALENMQRNWSKRDTHMQTLKITAPLAHCCSTILFG